MIKLIKVCPNCAGTNIITDGYELGVWDVCQDCKYGDFRNSGQRGIFFEIELKNLKGLQKEIKRKK
jgi:hypothetical protein